MRADQKVTAFLEVESAIRDCSIGSKLSLQRGVKFQGENGKRSAFPDYPGTQGHQTKQEKEITL
jgi:hypothetical protein